MHHWQIDSLKRELAMEEFTEERVLPYFLWFSGISTAMISLPLAEANRWDVIVAVANVALLLAGTSYAFQCNGGPAGTQFLVRYIALSWVLAVRFIVMYGGPFLVLAILFPISDSAEMTPWMALNTIVIECLFYWRLSIHMREVASASMGAPGSDAA